MIANLGDFLQDRNGDGVIDYVNARIYVPDQPTPQELAAAANIAARLAFETLSLDLPMGLPISLYAPSDTQHAIVIGRAAAGISGENVIALPDTSEAEEFARVVSIAGYEVSAGALSPPRSVRSPKQASLSSLFDYPTTIVLGPSVASPGVIDLAARVALDTTFLRLPLVVTGCEGTLPKGAILIGRSNPHVQQRIGETSLQGLGPGHGLIEAINNAFDEYPAVVIAGADDIGEAEAIRHAAERLPYAWDYGKECLSLAAVERHVHRLLSRGSLSQRMVAVPIFDETYDLPWEVDDALQRIEAAVLPKINSGTTVNLDLRISESPELRRELQFKIADLLAERGADRNKTSVRILCAHKQGYSWIQEELFPQMKDAARVRIAFRPLQPAAGSLDSTIRWLQELYPIDEIIARDLRIPVENISFERSSPNANHVYEVTAQDSVGRTILHATFNPTVCTRPLLESFPGYAHATVATGWLRTMVDGKIVIDEQIKTDPERFWDIFQSDTLPRIQEYILHLYDGNPLPECAPHFGELRVDVGLSEPDFGIGIDEERISTLEAIHEDIYFQTLLFFDVLGSTYAGGPLRYPGRIIPRVEPARPGGGKARIRFSGRLEPGTPVLSMDSPRATAVILKAGHRGVVQLDLRIDAAATSIADRATTLAFEDIDSLNLIFGQDAVCLRDHRAPYHHPRIPRNQEQAGVAHDLVQWNAPIGPEECERIVESLGRFPEVHPFYAGTSYLGRPIWAMDVTAQMNGKYRSQAKALVTKPSLFITGRQHANEVSSTSHILRLVELLVSSDQQRKLLDHVNFVIHPLANPDGAALVDEMHKTNPGFMLHAGYFGSLGVDITDQQWSANPFYPEAHVRTDLWRMWQPDVLLNPHGYPSHEWVQLFSGYSAWVRSRQVILRDWWIPRGWFLPRFEYLKEDQDWALALLDRTAATIEEVLGPHNKRMQRRYAKYGALEPETYGMKFHHGLLAYRAEKQPSAYSEITRLDMVTEVPDEVASGNWLTLAAQAGLEFSLMLAQFLAEMDAEQNEQFIPHPENASCSFPLLQKGEGGNLLYVLPNLKIIGLICETA